MPVVRPVRAIRDAKTARSVRTEATWLSLGLMGAGSSQQVVPPREIQEREEEDPDDVDEVPVEPESLDHVVVLGRVFPLPGRAEEKEDDGHADDHVEGVEAGHPEVEGEEEPGVL